MQVRPGKKDRPHDHYECAQFNGNHMLAASRVTEKVLRKELIKCSELKPTSTQLPKTHIGASQQGKS